MYHATLTCANQILHAALASIRKCHIAQPVLHSLCFTGLTLVYCNVNNPKNSQNRNGIRFHNNLQN